MKKILLLASMLFATSITFAQNYEHDNKNDSDLKSRHARTESRDFDIPVENQKIDTSSGINNQHAASDRSEQKAEHGNPNDSDLKKRHKRTKTETNKN